MNFSIVKLADGTRVTWSEPRKGTFTGTIARRVPAGTAFASLLPAGEWPAGINREHPSSKRDRFLVRMDDGTHRCPREDRLVESPAGG